MGCRIWFYNHQRQPIFFTMRKFSSWGFPPALKFFLQKYLSGSRTRGQIFTYHLKIKITEPQNFSPPIPEIASLKDNTLIKGYFSLSVDVVTGIMGGIYTLKKIDDFINIKMNPKKGWQPIPGRLWVKTYIWDCHIENSNGTYKIRTKWLRK